MVLRGGNDSFRAAANTGHGDAVLGGHEEGAWAGHGEAVLGGHGEGARAGHGPAVQGWHGEAVRTYLSELLLQSEGCLGTHSCVDRCQEPPRPVTTPPVAVNPGPVTTPPIAVNHVTTPPIAVNTGPVITTPTATYLPHCFCDHMCPRLGDCCYDYIKVCEPDTETRQSRIQNTQTPPTNDFSAEGFYNEPNNSNRIIVMSDNSTDENYINDRKFKLAQHFHDLHLNEVDCPTPELLNLCQSVWFPVMATTNNQLAQFINPFCAKCENASNIRCLEDLMKDNHTANLEDDQTAYIISRNSDILIKAENTSGMPNPMNETEQVKQHVSAASTAGNSERIRSGIYDLMLSVLHNYLDFSQLSSRSPGGQQTSPTEAMDVNGQQVYLDMVYLVFVNSLPENSTRRGARHGYDLVSQGQSYVEYVNNASQDCLSLAHVANQEQSVDSRMLVSALEVFGQEFARQQEYELGLISFQKGCFMCISPTAESTDEVSDNQALYSTPPNSSDLNMRLTACSSEGMVVVYPTVSVHSWLTLAGNLTSVLCSVLTLISFCMFPSLRTVPGKAIMFLTTFLMIAQISFQFNLLFVSVPVLCIIVAALQHFSWLSSFCWMNILALDLAVTMHYMTEV